MRTFMSSLLTSNEAPSESAVAQVKASLAEPLQVLAETSAEIKRLEQALHALKEQQNATQMTVDAYNTILSPARRLPPDILHEIFFHCLPTHRNPLMVRSEAPILLTRICSTWRAVAFESPRIWAKLHIPFPAPTFSGPSFMEPLRDPHMPMVHTRVKVADPQYGQVMQVRSRVIREWLERSGSCPISFSVNYPSYSGDFGRQWDKTDEIIQTLVSFAPRWQEIELVMPYDVYEHFEIRLSPEMLPQLRSVRGHFFERERSGLDPGHVSILRAPNLRSLSISSMALTWHLTHKAIPAVWSNLSYLMLHSAVPDTQLLDLFSLCTNLVHIKIMLLSKWDSHLGVSSYTGGGIILPRLESLSITDGAGSSVLNFVFSQIHTPALKWVDHHSNTFHPAGHDPNVPSPVVVLVQNAASTLTKLTIQPRSMLPKDAKKCFELPTKLRHLVLGQEPPFLKDGDKRPPHLPRPLTLELDSFDIELLKVPLMPIFEGHNSVTTTADDAAAMQVDEKDNISLPHLEVLEAYQVTSMSDKSLAHFICSRLRRVAIYPDALFSSSSSSSSTSPASYSPHINTTAALPNDPPLTLINGIAPLRKVVVEFDRPMQFDIRPEVEAAALAAGLSNTFELELYYAPNRPMYPGPFSASSGLMDNGKSWTYPELDYDG